MSQIKIERPKEGDLKSLGIDKWSSWGCEPSTFDWQYDSEEICYILEGRAKVKTPDGEVEIKRGDLVTFPQGLKCTWQVFEAIKKVYSFR